MRRGQALLLRAFAAWTVFVWVVGIRNFVINGHHSFGFRAVHGLLALVSVVFAVAAWRVVSQVRRRT
jgi:hypothetical protein